MKWVIATVFVVGCALTVWGYRITEGPGSADERVAGSIPVLMGLALIAVDVVAAFIYLLVRA